MNKTLPRQTKLGLLVGEKRPDLLDEAEAFMTPVNPLEVAWLAGLLEGEGSFIMSKSGKWKGVQHTSPLITLGMTDEDVVRRVAALWERAVSVNRRSEREGNARDLYSTRLSGDKAVFWMLAMFGFMGARRQAKMLEVVGLQVEKVPHRERARLAATAQYQRQNRERDSLGRLKKIEERA